MIESFLRLVFVEIGSLILLTLLLPILIGRWTAQLTVRSRWPKLAFLFTPLLNVVIAAVGLFLYLELIMYSSSTTAYAEGVAWALLIVIGLWPIFVIVWTAIGLAIARSVYKNELKQN